jgi:hypothetical protein
MLDIAKSTTAAEYIAASMARDEVMLTQSILSELGTLVPTTDSYVDNDATTISLMICKKLRVDHTTKHLDLHWHYVQKRMSRNEIRVVWVPANENAADLFMKSLDGQLFLKHCTALGLKCFLFLNTRQGEVLRPTRLYEHAVTGLRPVVTGCA